VIAIFGFFATPWFLLGAVGEAYVGVHSLFTRHAVRAMEYLGQFLLGILQLIATLGGWYALFAVRDGHFASSKRKTFAISATAAGVLIACWMVTVSLSPLLDAFLFISGISGASVIWQAQRLPIRRDG
jgi:hypothetical protein